MMLSFSSHTCSKASLVFALILASDMFQSLSPVSAFSTTHYFRNRVIGKSIRTTEYKIGPNLVHVAFYSAKPVQRGIALSAIENDQEVAKKKKRLPRAERKAKERAKKARSGLNNKKKKKSYPLHSNRISELTINSTADDVIKAIKRAQNLHDEEDILNIERFLLEEVDVSYAFGYRGSLLARLAVAALHLSNHELARKAIDERRLNHRSTMLPMESAGIIRGLLRVHNDTDALSILDDELSLPLEGTPLDSPESKDRLKHRALSIGSIASRHFYEGEPDLSVEACQKLIEMGPIIRESGLTAEELNMPWRRIIKGASECQARIRNGEIDIDTSDPECPCNFVYTVLSAMTTFPSDNDDGIYESLSNALIRRTVFVTGAVDMEGCPKADRGEVVFIGRSNVGKSSLVNMITNRKSLAYTSKRPGKTQQFNFFAVNDKPGREKEVRYGDVLPGEKDPDSFYMVDVPGFGFARVPDKQRKEWSDFLLEYTTKRKTLRVVFHLMDARHGPIDEDENIMQQMGETLPKNVKYVVILTKADKNIKGPSGKNSGKVSRDVLDKVRQTMKDKGVGNSPVFLTSAETKLGRDDVWRYLRLAAEI